MATLLYRLGLLSARKPWAVIIAWLLLLGGVSGAAAAFRTPLSSTMTVEGLEFQQTLDTLKREIPDAAGGIGTVVFRTEAGRFTPAQQAAVAKAVTDWEALPQVAERRVHHLPEINAFGGVPAALRFARLLSQALAAGSVAGI